MKDLWAEPPGGAVVAKTRRPWMRSSIAAAVIMCLGLGTGGMIKWMRTSTPVGVETALDEFRASESGQTDATEEGASGSTSTDRKRESRGTERGPRPRSVPALATGGQPDPGDAEEGRAGASMGGDERPVETQTRTRPREGVYTWAIDGFEEAPGTRRELPARSHRVITHDEGLSWTEHHIFSQQKEQWFGLAMTEEGVVTERVRNRVVIGPVTNDKTIDFAPPMFVSRFPFEVGQTWQGKWEGKTSGEYRARCFEHTTLTIGGEKVEVWATEVKMTMRGEIEGTSTVRSWVSPEHVLVVKQYQETEVSSGPADYYSEWSGRLLSLEPQQ